MYEGKSGVTSMDILRNAGVNCGTISVLRTKRPSLSKPVRIESYGCQAKDIITVGVLKIRLKCQKFDDLLCLSPHKIFFVAFFIFVK